MDDLRRFEDFVHLVRTATLIHKVSMLHLSMGQPRQKNHWGTRVWPQRKTMTPGLMNIVRKSLIGPEKIIFPPLHIKLGLIKQIY